MSFIGIYFFISSLILLYLIAYMWFCLLKLKTYSCISYDACCNLQFHFTKYKIWLSLISKELYNIMYLENSSNRSNFYDYLNSVNNNVFYASQVLAIIYTSLCIFWLVYVIRDLTSQIRNRRRLVALTYLDSCHDYANRLFIQRETILRNSIFLVFLCFEMVYCLIINIYEFLNLFYPLPNFPISIDPDCKLTSGTFLALAYDNRFEMLLLRFLGKFIRDISFSMLIWMLGASLLHLSYAARNEVRAKVILRFFLIGLIFNLIIAVLLMIPSTSLFGIIANSLTDQISLFFVLYIAKRKFFPAMNSRIIDAFHLNNRKVYLEQRRLLKRHKTLIYFLLFTFELYILKDLLFYNLYTIFESVCLNSCWFHVTLSFPKFTVSDSIYHVLMTLIWFLIILSHLFDLIFYFNIIIINLVFIYILSLHCFKRMNFYNKKRYRYRYQGFSAPLLS